MPLKTYGCSCRVAGCASVCWWWKINRVLRKFFSCLFKQWIAETISFLPVKNTADFKAAIEKAKVRGVQKAWLDTTERIRKGFAWIDIKAVSNWLIKAKGAEAILDLMTKLLQLVRQ